MSIKNVDESGQGLLINLSEGYQMKFGIDQAKTNDYPTLLGHSEA